MLSLFSLIRQWGSFVRFSHTVFALPFAIASMAIAARDNHGWPGWRVFLLILVCMVCARTCAMAFNRIVDRRFDAQNPRTAGRHLPAGQISLSSASALCVLSAVGLVSASWLINPLCFYLSPVALIVVCFYSLTKRFTDFTHIFLGVAIALAPLGAWIAVKGSLDFLPMRDGQLMLTHSALLPILLAAAVVFWLVGFDIIYATLDESHDRASGIHSLPARYGTTAALRISAVFHIAAFLSLALVVMTAGRLRPPWALPSLAVCGALLWLEHRRADDVEFAFFKVNAALGFAVLALVWVVA